MATKLVSKHCPTPDDTVNLGRLLAQSMPQGAVVHLIGELGVGKTTFARALLAARGVSGYIKSPSFTLSEVYEVDGRKYCHLDFYRCTSPSEWLDAGLDEDMEDADATLIEWAERGGFMAEPDLEVDFKEDGTEGARVLELRSRTARGRNWLDAL